MIQPPHKLKCQNCGYSKVVRSKSDALEIIDFHQKCPKCNKWMEKTTLSQLDTIMEKIWGRR